MKAIMMSIKPQHVANILNGLKTLEIRKKFLKDYIGWVYIYCTKDKQLTLRDERYILINGEKYHIDSPIFNGKVVARFWVDKVGNFSKEIFGTYEEPFTYNQDDLLKKSCLTEKELDDYLQGKKGYAIHITKLEIFDTPKEISEFYGYCKDEKCEYRNYHCSICYREPLTRAPQSFMFIGV